MEENTQQLANALKNIDWAKVAVLYEHIDKYLKTPITDWFKQITTISSASILIILACMEKVFKSPLTQADQTALNVLIATATCSFVVAIGYCQRGSYVAMWPLMIFLELPDTKRAKSVMRSMKAASWAFSIGCGCLALSIMLYFSNIILGFVPADPDKLQGPQGVIDWISFMIH